VNLFTHCLRISLSNFTFVAACNIGASISRGCDPHTCMYRKTRTMTHILQDVITGRVQRFPKNIKNLIGRLTAQSQFRPLRTMTSSPILRTPPFVTLENYEPGKIIYERQHGNFYSKIQVAVDRTTKSKVILKSSNSLEYEYNMNW
jgi:hypothetical protein